MLFLLWTTVVLILIVSSMLGALAAFSRSKLERYCQARSIDRLGKILEHDDDVVLALRGWIRVLLLLLVVWTFLAYAGEQEVAQVSARWLLALVGVWLFLVVAENWIARPIGESFAEPLLYGFWPILNALRLAMLPFLSIARFTSAAIEWFSGRDDDGLGSPIQEEILTVVNEGQREGQIPGEAVDMIAGLMELHEVEVCEIMTPRTDVIMFPLEMTIAEARVEVTESGHSRIPVYRQNRDDIIGILYAKDLLPHLSESTPTDASLASLQLRQPVYVPENKPVDILLREFRKGGVHIAIVLDEYGGMAGLVTIEDIIEEVVGDIRDEYDEDEIPPIRRIDENTHDIAARLDIETINDRLDLAIPEGADYDTLGGFVFSTLGRIPRPGESFVHDALRMTVTDATDRTVRRIRVEKLPEAPPVSPN